MFINSENIPSAVMFYGVVTLNLCKYIQALNLSGCQIFTERKNTVCHKLSVTDLKGFQLISESLEKGLK